MSKEDKEAKPKRWIKDRNYHGCVNTLPRDDERLPKFLKEYAEKGFDSTETWSLYDVIVKFTLPRLKHFRHIAPNYPASLESLTVWQDILDQMIVGFELMESNEFESSEENLIKTDHGLDLFREWFLYLWW